MLSPDGHEDLSVDAWGGARIPTLTVGMSKRSLFTSWESGRNDCIYLGTSALRGRHTHVHTCSETAPTCAQSHGFSGSPGRTGALLRFLPCLIPKVYSLIREPRFRQIGP